MKYELYSHRHALEIAQNHKDFIEDFNDILKSLDTISDQDIIDEFRLPNYIRTTRRY